MLEVGQWMGPGENVGLAMEEEVRPSAGIRRSISSASENVPSNR